MTSPNSDEKYPGYTKIGVVGKGTEISLLLLPMFLFVSLNVILGAFGTAVLFTRNEDGKKVVIKEINIIDMPSEARLSALNEVKVLAALNHQNIVKLVVN